MHAPPLRTRLRSTHRARRRWLVVGAGLGVLLLLDLSLRFGL